MKILKAAALLMLLIAFKSGAGQCLRVRGLAQSDAVFAGTVIGIRNLTDSIGQYEIEFEVDKWIKGERKSTKRKVYVLCLRPCESGYPFEMDAVYEVYTYAGPRGHLLTDACTENRKIADHWIMYNWRPCNTQDTGKSK